MWIAEQWLSLWSLVALITWIITAQAEPIANYLGVLDNPGGRKHHHAPTPLMGGVAILGALIPALFCWAFVGPTAIRNPLIFVAIVTFVLTMLGILDDRHDLRASQRLLLSIGTFVLIIFVEPLVRIDLLRFTGVAQVFPLHDLAVPATVFCLIGFQNAVNMADGKNGLVIGLSLFWTLILACYAPSMLLPPLIAMMIMLLVLLVYNLRGRLFLGDGGSYGLTAAIGLMAIWIYNASPRILGADVLANLFCVPVLDMVRLTLARAARGQSPFAGDRDHLHHHLLSRFGWPGGLAAYLVLAVAPSLATLRWPGASWLMLVFSILAYFMTIAVTSGSTEVPGSTVKAGRRKTDVPPGS